MTYYHCMTINYHIVDFLRFDFVIKYHVLLIYVDRIIVLTLHIRIESHFCAEVRVISRVKTRDSRSTESGKYKMA